MSVKEAIRRWIDEEPEESPTLVELYEKLRRNGAIPEGKTDEASGGVLSLEELETRWQEKRARRGGK